MAESTLSIGYDDLQIEVGRFLGYSATVASWDAGQVAEVDRYIQAGVRQFYYPPATDGAEAGYEWSFLKPVATLQTAIDDGEQDMPDGFGRIVGDLHFDASIHAASITVVGEHRILSLLQRSSEAGRPMHAAVRFKTSTGSTGQRQEIVWWPVPNAVYTLTYRYEAFAGKLVKTTNPYPLGGMKHSELIVESCLAVAEQRANDEKGLHWDSFMRMLASAVAQDRKNGARYFGAMSLGEAAYSDPRLVRRQADSYPITYKGDTW